MTLRHAIDMSEVWGQRACMGATSSMIARLGRSSRLGERTLEHEDAGANSMVLILRTIAGGVGSLEGSDCRQ